MYLDDSNATLSRCRFDGNVAEGSDLFGQLASFGGGLATRGPSHLTTIRCGLHTQTNTAAVVTRKGTVHGNPAAKICFMCGSDDRWR